MRHMTAEALPNKDPYSRTRQGLKMDRHEDAVIVGATGSNPELAKAVAKGLGLEAPAKTDSKRFADGESWVRIHDNVNGKHVYIV
jgi:phosphoribosylpyrophosphate synthetase